MFKKKLKPNLTLLITFHLVIYLNNILWACVSSLAFVCCGFRLVEMSWGTVTPSRPSLRNGVVMLHVGVSDVIIGNTKCLLWFYSSAACSQSARLLCLNQKIKDNGVHPTPTYCNQHIMTDLFKLYCGQLCFCLYSSQSLVRWIQRFRISITFRLI